MRRPKAHQEQLNLFDACDNTQVIAVTRAEQIDICEARGLPLPPEREPLPVQEVPGTGTFVPPTADPDAAVRAQTDAINAQLLGHLLPGRQYEQHLLLSMSEEERSLREWRSRNLTTALQEFRSFPLRKLLKEPPVRDLAWGWLLPYLLQADNLYIGRWDYLCHVAYDGKLTDKQGPIPTLDYVTQGNEQVWRMLKQCLDSIAKHGEWEGGWSSSEHFDYFLDWILYGLGHTEQRDLPKEPAGCEGASMRLYQLFQMPALLLWPSDYWGELMAQSGFGRAAGFYPTPHCLCELCTKMTCVSTEDMRGQTTCDPAVGTGRMLLHAGAHSMRLYGMDINKQCVKVCMINGALYVPWLYRPLRCLNRSPEPTLEYGDSLAGNVNTLIEAKA